MAEEESTPMEWTPTEMLDEEEKKETTSSLSVCKEEKARYSPPSDIFRSTSTQFGGMAHPYELIEGFEEDILQDRTMDLLMPNEYDMRNAYYYANEAMDQYNKRENANWEFVKLVTVNIEEVRHHFKGFMIFITFQVKDKAGSFDAFQAKVWQKLSEKHEVVRCRKKRPVTPKRWTVQEIRGCYPNPVHLTPASWKMGARIATRAHF